MGFKSRPGWSLAIVILSIPLMGFIVNYDAGHERERELSIPLMGF